MKHLERMEWSHRPHFFPRQMLTADQLNSGLDDEMMRQQLLNRAIHGYGVVVGFGLVVGSDGGTLNLHRGCLELTDGLALDRHGRMLLWRGGRIGIEDLIGPRPAAAGYYTLSAHFACRPPLADVCSPVSSDRSQWSKEGVVFTLREGCSDVDRDCPHHPSGSCVGPDEYLCRRTGGLPGHRRDTVRVSDDVGWLLRRPGELCPTDVDGWLYDPDPRVAVPLACVEICDLADREQDPDCEPCFGFCPSAPRSCEVRPFVYRNPLLYELANRCDVALSRVEWISWKDWIDRGWKERIPWAEFAQRLRTDEPGMKIRFTRPIQVATIHPASIFFAALTHERNSDYWERHQVPMRLDPIDDDGGLAWGVALVPDQDWLSAEVTGRRSSLFGGARFELTIRGQLLRDECGQVLDARPVGLPDGHGQAMPGGDFISVFRVRRRRDDGPAAGAAEGDADAAALAGAPAAGAPENAAE
jgi:hypothetical protein